MLFATSFAIRLDKSAQLAENKYPFVLQITFDRKVRHKRLGMSATLHQWDFENHEYKKGVHGRREKNEKLEEAEKKALKIYQEHFDGKPFNYKKFVTLFTQKPLEQMTVLDFCAEVSQKFLQNGQTRSCVEFTEEWLFSLALPQNLQ